MLTIILVIIIALVLYVAYLYNSLVRRKVRCQEGRSDIEVQLKRRHDLIPNLIESVKGYMAHEKGVLENVTQARSAIMSSKNTKEMLQKNDMLTGALKTLFAVSENYPDLKANTNFLQLQQELSDTEDKIMAARRFYNANVRDYNTSIQSMPSNIIAQLFKNNFQLFELFEIIDKEEKETPKVQF